MKVKRVPLTLTAAVNSFTFIVVRQKAFEFVFQVITMLAQCQSKAIVVKTENAAFFEAAKSGSVSVFRKPLIFL